MKKFLVLIIFLAAIGGAVAILINQNTPRSILTFADPVPAEYNLAVSDLLLQKDATVRFVDKTEKVTSDLVSKVTLPTVPYDSELSEISAAELQDAMNGEVTNIDLTDLANLSSAEKLLSVDGCYYLNEFTCGAVFETVEITGESAEDVEKIRERLAPLIPELPNRDTVLTINQTGVTALTRGMGTKLKSVGNATYFAEKIKDLLGSSDLAHISNEVSFLEGCDVDSGSTVLCADPAMMDAIEAIGTDIIELTGNHNDDAGINANLDTLKLYEEKGLKTFGGGKDEDAARIPLELSEKGTNITWLGYNLSTTKALAGGASGDYPGANLYDENTVKTQIAEAKARGDFVIVDIQYYECYCYPEDFVPYPACDAPISTGEGAYPDQTSLFRHVADLGADLVVGTQAHQPQTFEIYHGVPIYYGLGNLFFDQVYWPDTEKGLVLTHYFYQGRLLQTIITPTVYDTALQVAPMPEDQGTAYLQRLLLARPE